MAICNISASFLCSKTWEDLQEQSEPNIRFCNTCQKNVFRMTTISEEEMRELAHAEQCISMIHMDVERIGYFVPSFLESTDDDR